MLENVYSVLSRVWYFMFRNSIESVGGRLPLFNPLPLYIYTHSHFPPLLLSIYRKIYTHRISVWTKNAFKDTTVIFTWCYCLQCLCIDGRNKKKPCLFFNFFQCLFCMFTLILFAAIGKKLNANIRYEYTYALLLHSQFSILL